MVTALLNVGEKEKHLILISACSLSENVKISADGKIIFNDLAPRPPGIVITEIGNREKHILKVILKEGIVCSIDIYVDDKLHSSYP
jgi:hypothetical protein